MKIKQIKVNGLFNIFNHEINLNMEDKITLIHGPNGFGKTTILKMIDALFNKKFSILRRIPFTEFYILFEDETAVNIKKENDPERTHIKNKSQTPPNLVFEQFNGTKKVDSFISNSISSFEGELPISMNRIEHILPHIKRLSPDSWFDEIAGETISVEEILDNYSELIFENADESGRRMNETRQLSFMESCKDWLLNIIASTPVRFIKAQRLVQYSSELFRENGFRKFASTTTTVDRRSKELSGLIETKLAEYAALSQSLDRTFPVRVVNQGKDFSFSEEDLKKNLQRLEEKRNKFIETGLLDKDVDNNFQIPSKIDAGTVSVLSVYIADVEEKLGVLDAIANKIDIFKKLLESRFLFKNLIIKKDKGFIFTTPDGKNLAVTDLSSGEQHEIIMLYELLFKTDESSLILIDEPELSLHVAWQQSFLKDIQEIVNSGNFELLIATHSPQIINDRWDLTVELKGN